MTKANLHQLQQNRFQVVKTIKTATIEKQRILEIYGKSASAADTFQWQGNRIVKMNKETPFQKDSLAYYQKIMERPDFYETNITLNEDTLATTIDSIAKSFFFRGSIRVIYRNTSNNYDQSEIYLVTPSAVRIDRYGGYYPPQELVSSGYWGSHEKIANEIPVDYQLK